MHRYPPRATRGEKETRRHPVRALFLLFIAAMLASVLLFRIHRQRSDSMLPTLEKREFIIYSPAIYRLPLPTSIRSIPHLRRPRRGDLVLIAPPYSRQRTPLFSVLNATTRFFTLQLVGIDGGRPSTSIVRRVIALPGDRVRMEDNLFSILPSGRNRFQSEQSLISPTYSLQRMPLPAGWRAEHPFSGNMSAIEVPIGYLLVAADNRAAGLDSRHWGMLPEEAVEGIALLRYFPLQRFGSLRGR